METAAQPPGDPTPPFTARAVLLGERIDTAGLERREVLSTAPLSFRLDGRGFVVVFRYGVVVLVGLDALGEDEALRGIGPRVVRPSTIQEEETARLSVMSGGEERIDADGLVWVSDTSHERLLVVADALAKSVALAHDERQVAAVFDSIEPWARAMSEGAGRPGGRRAMIRMIGNALLVQQRVAGRVAVSEKPDILWDRPDLERLYARLEDEYELPERADILNRKVSLIGETARLMTELIDTERSLRLEALVVGLILMEIVLTVVQMVRR